MRTPRWAGCASHALLLGVALAGSILLGGCAASKPKPLPLEPLTAKISVRTAWNANVGDVDFPLAVSVNGGVFTMAGGNGNVLALDAATGRELWRASAGGRLSAGVGSDGRFAAVVTRDGELVTFEQGQPKWRKPLGVRVTTAPLVAGERVFVMGVDRVVQAFDALDGRKLWVLQRANDPLALAQNGVLAAFRDTLLVGQGPRLAGVDPLRGTVRWEVPIGSPRGANEIERLADLVGPMSRVGDVVCTRSFQAAVGCVNAANGVLAWSRNIGGLDAIAADADFVFAGDASDRLTTWKVASGDVAWTSDKLQYRGLSAPLATPKSVVYGDAEGLTHWFDRATGEAQLRLPTDGSAVVAAPVVAAGTVLFVTRKGGLYAVRPE